MDTSKSIEAGNAQQVYPIFIEHSEVELEGEFYLFSIKDKYFLMLIDHDNNVKFMLVDDSDEVLSKSFLANIEVKININGIPIASIPGVGYMSASSLLVTLIAQKHEKEAAEETTINYNFVNILA